VDGTEHRRLLTTKAQRDAALAAAEYRKAMLPTLSHELRTPLVGVMGNLDGLASMRLPLAQRRLAAAGFTCPKAVLYTANAILDHRYAKLEAGAVALEHLAFSPREVLREVGTIMGMRMSSNGLAWRVDVAPDVPAVVVGDPSRLRQILLNLVGNAAKFTATGGVTVSVVREGAGIETAALARWYPVHSATAVRRQHWQEPRQPTARRRPWQRRCSWCAWRSQWRAWGWASPRMCCRSWASRLCRRMRPWRASLAALDWGCPSPRCWRS